MKPEAQQLAIEQACGWTRLDKPDLSGPCACYARNPNGLLVCGSPYFLSDLNAMHEAEKVLNAGQINTYLGHLYRFNKVAEVKSNPWEIIAARVAVHATAAQRAEAFLRTLNLWKE